MVARVQIAAHRRGTKAVMPNRCPIVSIREVGLRDGLQSLARTMPTAQKQEWLRGAYDAGLREIEVGSFVPPRLLPQLADTAEVVAFAKSLPGLTVSVLVPNLKGAERAIESDADLMLLPLSASHAHSLANLRKTPDDVIDEIARIRDLRDDRGSKCTIEVGISTAFGCTIQGRVEPDEVLRLVAAALAAGAERVGLADTVGYADPLQVETLFAQAFAVAGERLACGHFHDTRGLGLANVFAAWQQGVATIRRVPGRPRRLSPRAGRERKCRHRGRRVSFRQHGRGDEPRFRPPDRAPRASRAVARRRDAARNAVARGIAEDDGGGAVTATRAG